MGAGLFALPISIADVLLEHLSVPISPSFLGKAATRRCLLSPSASQKLPVGNPPNSGHVGVAKGGTYETYETQQFRDSCPRLIDYAMCSTVSRVRLIAPKPSRDTTTAAVTLPPALATMRTSTPSPSAAMEMTVSSVRTRRVTGRLDLLRGGLVSLVDVEGHGSHVLSP
jgi:hypothetical protein